jgi:drug/metabolite transporter (DMT)-like permease
MRTVMPSSSATRNTALPLNSVGKILASMLCFAVVAVLAKRVALQYPTNEVTFSKCLSDWYGSSDVLPGRLSLTERQATIDIKGQTVRALTLLGSSGLFFASLPYVSLGEAVALAYLETLIVILLAPLILRGRWA